jgi:hypothetical protein
LLDDFAQHGGGAGVKGRRVLAGRLVHGVSVAPIDLARVLSAYGATAAKDNVPHDLAHTKQTKVFASFFKKKTWFSGPRYGRYRGAVRTMI